MSEHPNAAKVRELAAAFQTGDLDAVVGAYSDDCIYRVGGENLVSGTYVGHQQLKDFFIKLGEVTEGSMKLELEDTLADDHHAVMFWRLTAERQGKTLDANGGMAFKINDQGKFSESWFLYSDQREYDAFYS